MIVALVIAEVLIWFPEDLGAYTGENPLDGGGPPITQATPGCLVAGFGWAVLFALPVWFFVTL